MSVRGVASLLAVFVFLVAHGGATHAGRASIRTKDLRDHVAVLSHDRMAGRETGEPGITAAENYVAAAFKRIGLASVPGHDSPFIEVSLFRRGYDLDATTLEIDSGGTTRVGAAGADFRPFGFSDDGRVEAEVVFAGYGISAPEHDYDDFAELDVEGKIVLVLRHEPAENDPDGVFDGVSSSRHALFTSKAENAASHGAVGMLLVTDPIHHAEGDDLRLGGALDLEPPDPVIVEPGGGEGNPSPFLALQIDRATAEAIVATSGKDLETLQRAVDAGTSTAELQPEPVTARIAVRREPGHQRVRARNVAGFLEGSDPELKDQWIVVGGHHDHVGAFTAEGDSVFNGADDNASGVAGVLELAEAFAGRERRPRRSLVFITFTAEEKGLLGSRALIEQNLIPAERIAFMLNLDMIGRNPARPIDVLGDGFAGGLRGIVEKANRRHDLDLAFQGSGYEGNSDHDAFFREGIPFLFFFTGTHADYHRLGDHADKLDFRRMGTIVRLAYDVVAEIAGADTPLGFIHHVGWLGSRIELQVQENGSTEAVMTRVDPASKAADAGLQAGDVLTAIDDAPTGGPRALARLLRDIEPGAHVNLSIRRGSDGFDYVVERSKTGYVGIRPGAVDEDVRKRLGLREGEGILLRQVVAEGPAGAAGLRDGDILLRIGGRPVDTRTLRDVLAQIGAGETVEVAVLRDGERSTHTLTLGERPSRR